MYGTSNWQHDPCEARPTEEPDDFDAAIDACERGDIAELGELLQDDDLYSKRVMVLNEKEVITLRSILKARGLELTDDQGTHWYVTAIEPEAA